MRVAFWDSLFASAMSGHPNLKIYRGQKVDARICRRKGLADRPNRRTLQLDDLPSERT